MEDLSKLLAETLSENVHTRYNALKHLEADCIDKLQRFRNLQINYQKEIREIQLKVLAEYKDQLMLDFYKKWEHTIKNPELKPPKEMLQEMEVAERIDKFGCYRFYDLKVEKQDCTICSRRLACWGREETE